MPHPGSPENSFEEQLWKSRIQGIMNDYENFIKNDLPYLIIPGKYSEYLKKLIRSLYEKINSSLDAIEDPELSSEVRALVLSGVTRYKISHAWHTILDMAQNTLDIPKDLYFFMDSIYERLGGEEVPYFIKLTLTALVPGTLDICKYVLRPFLINLRQAFDYLANKKAYVIFTTPSIIKNPIDWALLIHEAAHILEEEKLQIVEKFYPELQSEPYLGGHNLASTIMFPVEEAMPNWALEIACDIISTISCGPIFGYRLLDNFLQEEKEIYETHPPIKKRLELISNELERCGWEEAASDIRTKAERVPIADFIRKVPLPQYYMEIIGDVREKMKQEGIEYQCTPELNTRFKVISERLNDLKPCITVEGKSVDLKDLLNASEHVEDKLKESQEFKDFLADMIRLLTARDLYQKYKSTLSN